MTVDIRLLGGAMAGVVVGAAATAAVGVAVAVGAVGAVAARNEEGREKREKGRIFLRSSFFFLVFWGRTGFRSSFFVLPSSFFTSAPKLESPTAIAPA
jgi:hypothetical protein